MHMWTCVATLALTVTTLVTADNSVVVNNRVRVTALSDKLVRIEPIGPQGFENRTTFMVVNRTAFPGLDLDLKSVTPTSATLTTSAYTITLNMSALPPTPPPGPRPMCDATPNTDGAGPMHRISTCSEHAASCLPAGASQPDCCNNCTANKECTAWIYDPNGKNCWLMAQVSGTVTKQDRVTGGNTGTTPASSGVGASVSVNNEVVWSTPDLTTTGQNLDWPSPTTAAAYAIKDYPRFFAPEWGPTPIPDGQTVDPALLPTNGFDYRNNVDGDTYVFLLGSSLDAWFDGRRAFVTLAGPTPVLPDWAFGTWFTFWHQYTEDEAKGEVERWNTDKLPLDVWALDMNWRNSPHGHQANVTPGTPPGFAPQHYYDYPNTDLFPDFADPGTGWFDWLKGMKLRTYFNDHPFPADNGTALQTTPDEVKFRHDGLTKWLSRGLTYWWFDANWGFSIPPPNVPYGGSGDGAAWDGMDNRVWGSYLYYTTNRVYNENNPNREHTMPPQAPLALTKYADGNMHPGLVQHQHPAQHRYPVWWTGDGVDLEASVESMVDSGVYDFKPYVHSDCGGDYRPKDGGDLLRWTAHCAFGSIHRFHGSAHQPWSYDNHTEDVIRQYLNMRYANMPTLISAGHVALDASFPLVARCDLYWPEHAADGASSNHQYIFLNDTLVAPIWDSTNNVTSRYVWIPPGTWTDAWSGETVTGPQNMSVSQPYERQPMWHRASGGLSIITSEPGLRVDDQDWSELTLEAFPAIGTDVETHRVLYGQALSGARTHITMATTAESSTARIDISAAEDGASRAWVVRLHLQPGQAVRTATIDGVTVEPVMIAPTPVDHAHMYFPFQGKGSSPAPLAGHVAELHVASSAQPRSIVVEL